MPEGAAAVLGGAEEGVDGNWGTDHNSQVPTYLLQCTATCPLENSLTAYVEGNSYNYGCVWRRCVIHKYSGNPGVHGVSYRGVYMPHRNWIFTPELQWQSRGKRRILQGGRVCPDRG